MESNSTLEMLDLVDEQDNVIGIKSRTEIYAHHMPHFRAINVFLMNSKGQLWIPRRVASKILFPLALDTSVGGHVKSGEAYKQAFERELLEELNIELNNIAYKYLGYVNPYQDNTSCFMHVYEIRSDITPDYNTADFIEYFWLTPQELLEKIALGENTKDDLPKLIKKFYINKL